MPLELDVSNVAGQISLREFIGILDSQSSTIHARSTLIKIAPFLKQLSNNRRFLIKRICDDLVAEDLRELQDFQKGNLYGPQVIILHTTPHYFIRANVWRPLSRVERQIKDFQYDVCHDHNFDILTVGYLGPGYQSRTYRYDADRVLGRLGEKVRMVSTGVERLTAGRVLLYRGKEDIHIQLPPEQLSISINVIPRSMLINCPQFQFDETNSRICRYLHSSGTELVVRMAGCLGDEGAIEFLKQISNAHPSAHVRALASLSQVKLAPQSIDSVKSQLTNASAIEEYLFYSEINDYGKTLKMHEDDS